MKLTFKMITLATCLLLPTVKSAAQNDATETASNRHSFNLSYSDGLTLGGASFWGMGLSDALTGTKRVDEQSTGVFGLGYRYSFNKRLKFGADLGFALVSSKIEDATAKKPYLKEKELNFMVLPTLEFVYFKRSLVEIYGSGSIGANFCRHSESGLTEKGKQVAQRSTFDTQFAYQVNPLGVRVGNSRIAGFAEAGLGYRGFITAGISLGF